MLAEGKETNMKNHLKAIIACLLILGFIYCAVIYTILTLTIVVCTFIGIMFYGFVYEWVNDTRGDD